MIDVVVVGAAAVVVGLLTVVKVEDGTEVVLLEAGAAEDEDGAEPPDAPPGPATEVVREPLSMYTPEKCQSSLEPSWVPRRSTPKCQSCPFEETEAEKGPAVRARSSEPVEW